MALLPLWLGTGAPLVPGPSLGFGNAEVTSVSCASAGNCSAGGYYADNSGHPQAFAVSQT